LFDSHARLPIVCDMADKHYRSLVKAVSWRVTGSIDTMIITYLITHRWTFALAVSGVELFTKVGLYYAHERIWEKLSFGRVKPRDKDRTNYDI
jgi:uncharacterized membrane protein